MLCYVVGDISPSTVGRYAILFLMLVIPLLAAAAAHRQVAETKLREQATLEAGEMRPKRFRCDTSSR